MFRQLHPPTTRYGCHECREDAEHVVSNRVAPEVRELYNQHLRGCPHCRRMHRLLFAVYAGPTVPPVAGPSPRDTRPGASGTDREFLGILRRMHEERPDPWHHRWALRTGIAALASCAAALAFSLLPPLQLLPMVDGGALPEIADEIELEGARISPAAKLGEDAETGLKHAAQAYGRIVGGSATVLPEGGREPSTSNTFSVGTQFQLDATHTLQLGFIGKMVANFTPGADVTWESASPSLIELRVDRGIAAFRYDRDPSDPVLQVRTPTALVRVVGTVFSVQVDDEDDTIVSVLRGQVDVIDPATNRTMAEVESGYRYAVGKATFDDVGKIEVQAALPLSLEDDGASDPSLLPSARIPGSWNVPGLSSNPEARILANVPDRTAYVISVPSIHVAGTTGPDDAALPATKLLPLPRFEDEGDDLIAELSRDVAATRHKEVKSALDACRELYDSHETRYRAARCFSSFLAKYGDDPSSSEAWALLGILRMDYALDYRAAEVALETYLRRAPNGPQAEIAMYRMWLASVEDGRIATALARGHGYLERYPNGRFVGKILQRFPELKSAI